MGKYAFATEEEKMSDVLGISENRFQELHEAVKKTAIAAYLTDDEIHNFGKALEMLINEALPTGIVEAMALGWMYGQAEQNAKAVAKKIAKMIE